MASREKLNAASAFAIGELSLASTLIVDGEPDAALRQQLVQSGVEIVPPFSGSAAGAQGLIAA